MTLNRVWYGEMHLVALYNRALDPGQVEQNFDAGPDGLGLGGPLAFPGTTEFLVVDTQDEAVY